MLDVSGIDMERTLRRIDRYLRLEPLPANLAKMEPYSSHTGLRAIRDTSTGVIAGVLDIEGRTYYDHDSIIGKVRVGGRELDVNTRVFVYFHDSGWDIYCK